MANKSKKGSDRSTATIDLGKERKERITRFRAQKVIEGQPIPTIEVAVNILVDRGLEAEALNQ